MQLNITQFEVEGFDSPELDDSQVLLGLLRDGYYDEAAAIIETYDPTEVIFDGSESSRHELQDLLASATVLLYEEVEWNEST